MQAYTGFAQVYDTFMDNVPYDDWVNYLTGILQEYGVKDGLVLELGCGTGKITRRLAGKGYDLIGIDISEEMLEIAREKEFNQDLEIEDKGFSPILYLQQDMRDFELYGTVGAVVSICDSMNYITSEEDLLKVFQLVNNYLDPGGIFIFDLNTEYKYKNLLADNTIAENRDECSFIWENYYDEAKQINEYNVTIFVKIEDDETDEIEDENIEDEASNELVADKQEKIDGIEDEELVAVGQEEIDGIDGIEVEELETDEQEETDELETEEYRDDSSSQIFARFQETHYQKAYSIDQIEQLIEKAGLELITIYDAFTHRCPKDTSERIYFIAKEKYQENKKYI